MPMLTSKFASRHSKNCSERPPTPHDVDRTAAAQIHRLVRRQQLANHLWCCEAEREGGLCVRGPAKPRSQSPKDQEEHKAEPKVYRRQVLWKLDLIFILNNSDDVRDSSTKATEANQGPIHAPLLRNRSCLKSIHSR